MLYEQFSTVYQNLFAATHPALTSDSLKGLGIHVINPIPSQSPSSPQPPILNEDPNNPKADYGFFTIIEHLDGTTVENTPISHEIWDYSSGGTHIEGDSQNYTFYNDGKDAGWGPYHPCKIFGNYHDITTNTGHFASVGGQSTTNIGPKASVNDIIHAGTGNDVVYGLTGNDTLYGDDGHDILDGGTGNDVIYGGDGIDFLFAGDGDDYLNGGSDNGCFKGGRGADTIIGGSAFDMAVYEDGTVGVYVELTEQYTELGYVGYGKNGEAEGDILYSIEGIVGSSGNDTLIGDSGDNELWGNEGDDRLEGGSGNDILYGGEGSNTLIGGYGNDMLYGGEGSDTFMGNQGEDVLRGGEGNDYYMFLNGSQVDTVIETGSSLGDAAYFVGITELSIYKNANDLILTANNNADQMVIADWYVNKGIDIVYFYDTDVAYNAAYVASLAYDITPKNTLNFETFSLSSPTNILSSTASDFSINFSGVDIQIGIDMLSC